MRSYSRRSRWWSGVFATVLAVGLVAFLIAASYASGYSAGQRRVAPDWWAVCTGTVNGQPLAQSPGRAMCGTWDAAPKEMLIRRVRR